MNTWIVIGIIIVALAFIISTMTALLKSKPFVFSEEYEKTQENKKEHDESEQQKQKHQQDELR
jgi:flagellar basal body-associated protein FliL